jgi:hypothetical protein
MFALFQVLPAMPQPNPRVVGRGVCALSWRSNGKAGAFTGKIDCLEGEARRSSLNKVRGRPQAAPCWNRHHSSLQNTHEVLSS